ncbi:hypothetical protein AO738_08195 [Pseudomonas citronellolis]|nr:hypothetical protein AO742_07160 [Pseudomonas citronellolis]KRW78263.1 hypothetical protein AO738_08195 [Pseudomonas citronellolis]
MCRSELAREWCLSAMPPKSTLSPALSLKGEGAVRRALALQHSLMPRIAPDISMRHVFHADTD